MAGRRNKRQSNKRDFVKTFLFLLLLLVGTSAGFFYHSNTQTKGEMERLRIEMNRLQQETHKLRAQIKDKDAELAELKIQAVIKDSDSTK